MFSPIHVYIHKQHHRDINLWKLTLWFFYLTCGSIARVLFFLCVVLFALKCSVLWQKTHPALGAPLTVPTLVFSNLRSSRCCPLTSLSPSSESEVTPALLLSCSGFSLSTVAGKSFCGYPPAWFIKTHQELKSSYRS